MVLLSFTPVETTTSCNCHSVYHPYYRTRYLQDLCNPLKGPSIHHICICTEREQWWLSQEQLLWPAGTLYPVCPTTWRTARPWGHECQSRLTAVWIWECRRPFWARVHKPRFGTAAVAMFLNWSPVAGSWFKRLNIHRLSWISNDGRTKKELDHILAWPHNIEQVLSGFARCWGAC